MQIFGTRICKQCGLGQRDNKMDVMEFRQPAHVQKVLSNPKHF